MLLVFLTGDSSFKAAAIESGVLLETEDALAQGRLAAYLKEPSERCQA